MAYNGTIELVAGIKPKNNGNFPLMSANDVYVDDNTRLDAALNGKAPAIISSVTGYSHENVSRLAFNGNASAWGNAKYANKKNLIRLSEKTGTSQGVAYHVNSNNVVEWNGTCAGSDDLATVIEGLNIPAGTYTFRIDVFVGTGSAIKSKNVYVDLFYEGASSYSVRGTLYIGSSSVSTDITTTEKVVKMKVWYGVKSGAVYNDYRLFYSLFPSEVIITDTGEAAPSDGTLDYTLPSALAEIDTMMHTSTISDVIDTKTYVDQHSANVDLVYIKPEDYGAYGDGSHDDSVALQDCITAAQKQASNDNNICVRGYGRYKIATGLVIHGRELDIFLKSIIYTGDDAAVTISAAYSKFEFGSIRATAGGANAKGIVLAMQSASGATNGFNWCELNCNYLFTNGNGVEYVNLGGSNSMYYDVFHFAYQRSVNGHLIYIPGNAVVNEIDFYGKTCVNENGYVLYFPSQYGASIRLHEYAFEANTKNAVYGKATLLNCRFTEMMNLKSTSNLNQGNVFVFDGITAGGLLRSEHPVDITAIDVSGAWSFQDALDAIKAKFDANPSIASWMPFFEILNISNGRQLLQIDNCMRSANANMTTNDSQAIVPYGKIVGYYDKIAYAPYSDIYALIDDDFTVRLSSENNYEYVTPTIFDIDAASVDIHLDPSYSCYAINKFDVIQHSGKTAVVYDKNNNKIFDGTNLSAGVYHFNCSMVQLTSLSITMTNGTVKNCPASMLPAIYTGDNERWTVTKEELVSEPSQQSSSAEFGTATFGTAVFG